MKIELKIKKNYLDEKNIVYIITWRGTHLLNNWFGSVKKLGFVAETWFYI